MAFNRQRSRGSCVSSSRREAPQVSVEQLRLGESVVVSHVPAASGYERATKEGGPEGR